MKFRDWLLAPEGSPFAEWAGLDPDDPDIRPPCKTVCYAQGSLNDDWQRVLSAFRLGVRHKLLPKHCKNHDIDKASRQFEGDLTRAYFFRFQDLHERNAIDLRCLELQAYEMGQLTSAVLRLHRGESNSKWPKPDPKDKLRPRHLGWARDLLAFWFHKHNKTRWPVDIEPPTFFREFDNGCGLC
jgi:hypothetical protein